MKIVLGNPKPREGRKNDKDVVEFTNVKGPDALLVQCPDDWSFEEVRQTLMIANGIWDNHAQPGSEPEWVECSDEKMGRRLASYFDVPNKRPKDYLSKERAARLAELEGEA